MKLQLSWARFYEQFKADFKLWCYFVLLQQICRLYFIFTLAHYLDPKTKFTTILYAMLHGARFDSLWATCWLFIALIFFTLPSFFIANFTTESIQKYRRFLGGVFTLLTTLMYITSIEYFREYKDVFNQFLFGWFYDDKLAILKTIYNEHHVVLNAILLCIILLLYTKASAYFMCSIKNNTKNNAKTPQYSLIHKITLTTIIILFYLIAFRASIGRRPIQQKDAGITTDAFLNKLIISPYSSLKYAIDDYYDINQLGNSNANLSTHDIQIVAQKFFNTDKQYSTLIKYLEKTAKGSSLPRPKHIFLIVGESLDAWPLQDQYSNLQLTPNLNNSITNGIYFKYFLPYSDGTMTTLNSIITGIPDARMHINYQKSSYTPYLTSITTQFKKLGFKLQFFYGGYLSWQRVGDFANDQGFDAVYGAAHINNWQHTNEWGVDDKTLFNFIISTMQAATTPTFNIIMTTSNHPPFSVNLEQEGFYKTNIAKLASQYSANINLKELGHIWYADKTIGEFIKKIIAIDKTALFAITGDHFGRRHIANHPSLFETSAVPLIIYSDKIKNYLHPATNSIAGSQLDLGATLIELVAPRGFTYYAMGDNLLASRKFNAGLGQDKIITPDFIASINTKDIMYFKNTKLLANQLTALQERYNQAILIARHLVIAISPKDKGDI